MNKEIVNLGIQFGDEKRTIRMALLLPKPVHLSVAAEVKAGIMRS